MPIFYKNVHISTKNVNIFTFLMKNSVTSGGLRPPDPPKPDLITDFQGIYRISYNFILNFNKI